MQEGQSAHQLTDVVAPGQEEHARVVLLPVRAEKREHHSHEDGEAVSGRQRVLPSTEHREDADRHQQRRPAVQPVVEQLAERTARVGPTSLLPVCTIC